jgi:hypothetical protein
MNRSRNRRNDCPTSDTADVVNASAVQKIDIEATEAIDVIGLIGAISGVRRHGEIGEIAIAHRRRRARLKSTCGFCRKHEWSMRSRRKSKPTRWRIHCSRSLACFWKSRSDTT